MCTLIFILPVMTHIMDGMKTLGFFCLKLHFVVDVCLILFLHSIRDAKKKKTLDRSWTLSIF